MNLTILVGKILKFNFKIILLSKPKSNRLKCKKVNSIKHNKKSRIKNIKIMVCKINKVVIIKT